MSVARPTAAFADRVRADFPVFRRRVAGRPIAFFDGPGGSQVPRPVADAVAEQMLLHAANTHGPFATSRETDAAMAEGRRRLAAFVGAPSPREIVFGPNMTTLTFHFARALARGWREGDEVVVTALDHQANVAPWRAVAEQRGATVRVVPFDPATCRLDLDGMARLVGPRTRLVAVGAASNAVGTVNDVARAAEIARAAGALCYVDAVHLAPHRVVDVAALGCDALACSTYKFYGPHLGVLWARDELLAELTPDRVPPASNEVPERWEQGTQPHESVAGVAAAVEWIASLGGPAAERTPGVRVEEVSFTGSSASPDDDASSDGLRARIVRGMEALRRHEEPLLERLLDGLEAIRGVRVFGPPRGGARTPTVAFRVDGVHPDEVARRLAEEGVFVWAGDFYAPTVMEGLGVARDGGVVRAGLAAYSTEEDVERLLEGVRGM